MELTVPVREAILIWTLAIAGGVLGMLAGWRATRRPLPLAHTVLTGRDLRRSRHRKNHNN